MKAKPLIVLLLFFVWGAGSTYWYVCKIKGFCTTAQAANMQVAPSESVGVSSANTSVSGAKGTETVSTAGTEAGTVETEMHDVIYYRLSDATPQVADDSLWEVTIRQLVSQAAEGKKLAVTGPYYAFETNNSPFPDLGTARAQALKAMLAAYMDTSQVIVRSLELPEPTGTRPAEVDGFKNYLEWVTYNDYVKMEQDVTRIYFPFNSAREIRNPQIDRYLDEIAAELKADPGLKVIITGYTDNIGSAEVNQYKGMERAQRIRDILVSKGVSPGQIVVRSGGESNPIGDNRTREGRRQNRRVEIQFSQS